MNDRRASCLNLPRSFNPASWVPSALLFNRIRSPLTLYISWGWSTFTRRGLPLASNIRPDFYPSESEAGTRVNTCYNLRFALLEKKVRMGSLAAQYLPPAWEQPLTFGRLWRGISEPPGRAQGVAQNSHAWIWHSPPHHHPMVVEP